jgi:Mg-chelatase subunit ChlD
MVVVMVQSRMRWVRRLMVGVAMAALAATSPASAQRIRPIVDAQQQPARPHIDVVFVLDATGSMGDEIEPVKQHIWNIANQIAAGNPRPELRVGLVVYRDRGDAEPTRMVALTGDLDRMHGALMGVTAQGGGDYPEDVDAGLALALHEMNWGERSARMVFLVGDAPAQRYPEHDHNGLVRYAADHQIEVSTIECSGLDARGRSEFAAIAQRTHGMMTALTYAQDQQMADGRTQTILRQGGQVFVSDRRLTDEERNEGADVLSRRGLARPARPAEVAMAEEGGRPGRGGAPAPAATNNITSVITRRVQSRASAMGVAY